MRQQGLNLKIYKFILVMGAIYPDAIYFLKELPACLPGIFLPVCGIFIANGYILVYRELQQYLLLPVGPRDSYGVYCLH
jgi:hypothetical protein